MHSASRHSAIITAWGDQYRVLADFPAFMECQETVDAVYRDTSEWTRKAIINVGSVGQPRDGDPRACYVLFDGETVQWRRVAYDFEITMQKIYTVQQLDNFFADRLRDGR